MMCFVLNRGELIKWLVEISLAIIFCYVDIVILSVSTQIALFLGSYIKNNETYPA